MEYKRVKMTESQENRVKHMVDDVPFCALELVMSVEEVHWINQWLGTVVTGFRERGYTRLGEEVHVIAKDGHDTMLPVKEIIEYKSKSGDPWQHSDFISLRFDLFEKDIIREGDIIITMRCTESPPMPPIDWSGVWE